MGEDVTRSVVRRHLAAWQSGDVPGLLADYADDAVMLSGAAGALIGREAIGAMYGPIFERLFPPADSKFEVTAEVVSGDYALVKWTSETSVIRAIGGCDTFVLRDGKIVAHSGSCEIVPRD